MMQKTHEQLKSIFLYLKDLGIDDEGRRELVNSFTNGRSQSCKDLYFGEARELISHLRSKSISKKPGDKMRKKVIGFFHEMGYSKNGVIDLDHVNKTLIKYGYLHKQLNDYTVLELPMLISQVENMRDSYLKAARE